LPGAKVTKKISIKNYATSMLILLSTLGLLMGLGLSALLISNTWSQDFKNQSSSLFFVSDNHRSQLIRGVDEEFRWELKNLISTLNLESIDVTYSITNRNYKIDNTYIESTDNCLEQSAVLLFRLITACEKRSYTVYLDFEENIPLVSFQWISPLKVHKKLLIKSLILVLCFIMVTFFIGLLTNTLIKKYLTTPIEQFSEQLKTIALNLEKGNGDLAIKDVSNAVKEVEDLVIDSRIQVNHILKLQSNLQEASIHQAIAGTTQMFAHDVRKPFSTIKILIDRISAASSPAVIQELCSEALPSVKNSIKHTNHMINDLLNNGNIGEPEPILISSAIDDALEISNLNLENIDLAVSVDEHLATLIDHQRFVRTINNILSNGAQAICNRGKIWIRTIDIDDGYFEIKIGNNGPAIPGSALSQLFTPFFTSGKKGGTGLGLAITKKFINENQGRISCKNLENGVEFTIRLRKGRLKDPEVSKVNLISDERITKGASASSGSIESLCIVDDDPFILSGWEDKLGKEFDLLTLTSKEELVGLIEAGQKIDAVITDYYFNDDEDGLIIGNICQENRIPAALSSDGEFRDDVNRLFSRIIGKSPLNADQVRDLFSETTIK
jgi:signal transduction histidine kinase